MNVNEKIDHIREVAMADARAEGNQIIENYEKSLKDIYYTHKKEMEETAKIRIVSARTSSRQKLNATVSKEQLNIKKEINLVQSDIKHKIFAEVKEMMDEFMKTDEYKEKLISYINGAAKYADGSPLTLYINYSDEYLKGEIEERTGMSLTVSSKEDDFYGGIKAVVPEKNILIDRTYKSEMDNQYEQFTFSGGVENA